MDSLNRTYLTLIKVMGSPKFGCGLLAVAWLGFLHRQLANPPVFLYALYFLCVLMVDSLVVDSMGIFTDFWSLRYFLPLLIISAFWGLPFVFTFVQSPGNTRLAALVITVVMISIGGFALLLRDWHGLAKLSTFADYYPSLVKCIDENAVRLRLKNGIATYWQARYVTALSKNHLQVAQVTTDLSLLHWLNSLAEFNIEPEFVLIDVGLPEGDDNRIDEKGVLGSFGEPAIDFQCESIKALVFNRSSDVGLKKLFKGQTN